jgi:hypothetical protein
VHDFGKRAEFLQKRFGERLGVAPWQGGEQRHFQQLVVAQRTGAGVVKTRAQPLAVAVIMRRLFAYGLLLAWIAVFAAHGRNVPGRRSFATGKCRRASNAAHAAAI